jgi:hypothetical protein
MPLKKFRGILLVSIYKIGCYLFKSFTANLSRLGMNTNKGE